MLVVLVGVNVHEFPLDLFKLRLFLIYFKLGAVSLFFEASDLGGKSLGLSGCLQGLVLLHRNLGDMSMFPRSLCVAMSSRA